MIVSECENPVLSAIVVFRGSKLFLATYGSHFTSLLTITLSD